MSTQTLKSTGSEQRQDPQQKIQRVRELYAGGAEIGQKALETLLREMASHSSEPKSRMESAGRTGKRQGTVSELTMIAPLARGGAERLRALMELRDGNFDDTDRVGTVHDMRFVFLENDTKMLFATAYDGDWDAYIDDFVAKIPDGLDVLFSVWEGWPGIHNPTVKDWIAEHQIPATGWYVAHPNLTVRDIRRLENIGKAADDFLDRVGN